MHRLIRRGRLLTSLVTTQVSSGFAVDSKTLGTMSRYCFMGRQVSAK